VQLWSLDIWSLEGDWDKTNSVGSSPIIDLLMAF
jgi:hypothetical protein